MILLLTILLRLAGGGLIILAFMHIQIGRQLGWRCDVAKLTPANASIFYVHTFFICLVLVMMGLPSLLDPMVFLDRSRAGIWVTWSFTSFWLLRLYFQWFVYEAILWKNKPLETFIHWLLSAVWTGLILLFGACGLLQSGWLHG